MKAVLVPGVIQAPPLFTSLQMDILLLLCLFSSYGVFKVKTAIMYLEAISIQAYSDSFLYWSGELRTCLHSQPTMSHPIKGKVRRGLNMIRIQSTRWLRSWPCCQAKLHSYVASDEPSVTRYVNQTPALNNMFIGKLITVQAGVCYESAERDCFIRTNV